VRKALALSATTAAAFASVAGAAGPQIDVDAFRYMRTLGREGAGPVVIEPDSRLFAHTQPGLADLRIVTETGSQVAWRPYPDPPATMHRQLAVVYRGTQDGKRVVLFDTGSRRRTLDEIELDVLGGGFVGRADVLGSDDRTTFTKLSSTVVYDITGASNARSTTVVFPRTSVRYYLVRAARVPEVAGGSATVVSRPGRPEVKRPVRRVSVSARRRVTLVTLDLGFRRVPVDSLRLIATTPVYDREVEVRESGDGRAWRWAAGGRVFRLPGSRAQELDVSTSSRFLRIAIANGDDRPLTGIQVTPVSDSRAILVKGGDPGLLRMVYGRRTLGPPEYDFELLPVAALGLGRARTATLGQETRIPASLPSPDVTSFFERYDWLVPGLLGLAAFAIGAAGLVTALKPRRLSG